MQLKELFLIGPDGGRRGGRDDGRFQVGIRLHFLCSAPSKELVVNLRRTERVQCEARIASKICAFG
jgi:hypothetical protein